MSLQIVQNNIIPIKNNLIRVSFANHEEWLKGRTKGLGGSDASAILGMNPYKTNVELWEEKTGRRKSEDIGHKPCVQYGKAAEAPLRELFKLDYPEYEVYYKEFEGLSRVDYPFLKASLDGELTELSTGRKGILEIKTTEIKRKEQWDLWDKKIPQHYFIQVLHYFLVTFDEFAMLKAQLKSAWDNEIRLTTKHYPIERKDHEQDIEFLLQKEIEFWDCVVNDRRPNLILPAI